MKIYITSKGDEVLLDDVDYQYLIIECKYKYWAERRRGRIIRIVRNTSRAAHPEGKQFHIYLHWDILGKPPEGKVTDHKNRRPWDNQKHNIRFITKTQNNQNRKLPKSGFWEYTNINQNRMRRNFKWTIE